MEEVKHAARSKSPNYWVGLFNYWSSFKSESSDPKRVDGLIKDGSSMIEQQNTNGLKGIVNQIYGLLPEHVKKDDSVNYDSGIY